MDFIIAFLKSFLIGFVLYIIWGVAIDYIPKGLKKFFEEPFNFPGVLILWCASQPILDFMAICENNGLISSEVSFFLWIFILILIVVCYNFVGIKILKLIKKHLPDAHKEVQND